LPATLARSPKFENKLRKIPKNDKLTMVVYQELSTKMDVTNCNIKLEISNPIYAGLGSSEIGRQKKKLFQIAIFTIQALLYNTIKRPSIPH